MAWLSGWKKRIPFTIDHDDIGSALDWFPAVLHLNTTAGISDVDLTSIFTEIGENCKKIAITKSDGLTELYGEIEKWPSEATEEQTDSDASLKMYNGYLEKIGQRLTISNRLVSKLSFEIYKNGSPTGDVTFAIRKIDDTLIASKVLGDASTLETTATWEEVTLDTTVYINEEVRISCDYVGGDASNYVYVRWHDASSVKSDEISTYYFADNWLDNVVDDGVYKYTYLLADAVIHSSRDGWAIADDAATPGYLYYDNTHADNDAYIGIPESTPAEKVWASICTGSYSMKDKTTSTIADSTDHDNDGTKKAANQPLETTSGKIGNAQDFSGGNYFLDLPTGLNVRNDHDFYISCWLHVTLDDQYQYILHFCEHGYVLLRMNELGDNKLEWDIYDGSHRRFFTPSAVSVGWHRMSMSYDVSEKLMKGYLNGAYVNEVSVVDTSYTYGTVRNTIGCHVSHATGAAFHDIIDEVHVLEGTRDADWDKAAYESERDHLITWGSEEKRTKAYMHHYKLLEEN